MPWQQPKRPLLARPRRAESLVIQFWRIFLPPRPKSCGRRAQRDRNIHININTPLCQPQFQGMVPSQDPVTPCVVSRSWLQVRIVSVTVLANSHSWNKGPLRPLHACQDPQIQTGVTAFSCIQLHHFVRFIKYYWTMLLGNYTQP